MMKGFKFIVLIACTLTVVTARAQYYSINIDVKTAAAMASAYATETVAETYYNEQLSKIREHYQAAEVAAAGIHGFCQDHAQDMDCGRYDVEESP